jgi:hypothetical protein
MIEENAVTASGTVITSGWGKGELIEYVYITPPSDGYYEFDFVAEPPSSDLLVTQGIRPILATFILDYVPEDIKGIKVYSSGNSREESYEEAMALTLQISRIGN